MIVQCLNFFQQVDSNGWILKSFIWISIPATAGCGLEVDLEYPKELMELHKDYP